MDERRDHLANFRRAHRLLKLTSGDERRRFAEIGVDYAFKAQMLSEAIRESLKQYQERN